MQVYFEQSVQTDPPLSFVKAVFKNRCTGTCMLGLFTAICTLKVKYKRYIVSFGSLWSDDFYLHGLIIEVETDTPLSFVILIIIIIIIIPTLLGVQGAELSQLRENDERKITLVGRICVLSDRNKIGLLLH